MENRESKVFVVTGGASGLGAASAHRLGLRGIVLLCDIDSSGMARVAGEMRSEGMRVETIDCDISDRHAVKSLAETAASLGRFAGLVNAAGLAAADGMSGNWRRIFEVNLVGTALLAQEFLPLAEPGSAAVCFASGAGHQPVDPKAEPILDAPLSPDFIKTIEPFVAAHGFSGDINDALAEGAYTLSKRGVISLCRRAAAAWGQRGARIISLSPGLMDTPMAHREIKRNSRVFDIVLEVVPSHRMGTAYEAANLVNFLLSEEASFISGTDISIDGGYLAGMAYLGK